MKKRFNNYLRAHRRGRGFTQKELGDLIGSENGAKVSKLERQQRIPKLVDAFVCAVALKVPVEELFPEYLNIAKQRVQRRARVRYRKLKGQPQTHRVRRKMKVAKSLGFGRDTTNDNQKGIWRK